MSVWKEDYLFFSEIKLIFIVIELYLQASVI